LRRLALLVVVSACASSMDADQGRDAALAGQRCLVRSWSDARAERRARGGGILVQTSVVRSGTFDKPLGAALGGGATAALLGLAGDTATGSYGPVRPDVADADAALVPRDRRVSPSLPTAPTSCSCRRWMPPGKSEPPPCKCSAPRRPPRRRRRLVVSLTWTTRRISICHVIDASGVEIWKGNINSYALQPARLAAGSRGLEEGRRPGFSITPCVSDGRRRENVVWKTAPPLGPLSGKVDTFSLCGRPARMGRRAALRGSELAAAFRHGDGRRYAVSARGRSGVLAFTFDVR